MEKNGLKMFMEKNQLTAREVANELGFSIHTVHAYMQGTRFPNRHILKKFEAVYGVDYRTIFNW